MPLFTASKRQVATYLLCVCPFSIAFLVFLNSSVSFVITDLLGKDSDVGNDVGTLGFADELLALIACPLWGLLSDRIGVRKVCFLGYGVVGLALFTFVQAKNVYPQLLLARLFFSIGGAAVSTMVTAVLPTMTGPSFANQSEEHGSYHTHRHTASRMSQATVTQDSYLNDISRCSTQPSQAVQHDSHSTVAGLVGMATGCGALVALVIFLPLPARFQHAGTSPDYAIQYSYYIVASFALLVSILCLFGLRDASRDESRDWDDEGIGSDSSLLSKRTFHAYTNRLYSALRLGFTRREIFVGYIGGFVARASSVAISLFIPLLVNSAFLGSGLCEASPVAGDPSGLPDIKRRCPRAYVLAAALTGVSQFVALLSAPLFGFWSSRIHNKMLPLMVSALLAIIGYPLFALRFSPDDSDKSSRIVSFVAVCLIGIGQIGSIVCSLAAISSGLVKESSRSTTATEASATESTMTSDQDPLLRKDRANVQEDLTKLKGSVAGIYSFYGGAAILILTKAGGALFDSTSTAAPFYMMATFNAIMLLCLSILSIRH